MTAGKAAVTKRKAKDPYRSQFSMICHKFATNKLAMVGLVILITMAVLILAAPLYIDPDAVTTQRITERFQLPNAEHWFGTDQFGRDLFSRIVYGGRISFFAGFASVGISFVFGCLLGGIAGYFGGKTSTVIMRVVDVFMAIPGMLLSMAVVAALGQGVFNMLVALSFAQIPRFTRVVRASVMSLRDQDFVYAAKCGGMSQFNIILKHILPNGLGPVIVTATLSLGQTILSIAALGFLGIGIASPTPEWGTIISENRNVIRYYPYLGIFPGIFIGLTVMALNFVGDGLRDAMDPRTNILRR